MVTLSTSDAVLLSLSTSTKAQLAALKLGNKWHQLPIPQVRAQLVSDRLALAGEHLRHGDVLLAADSFRAAIGRYYYAMYHGARAVVFGDHEGDDYEQHSELPRHLPPSVKGVALGQQLIDARLLRNQADYDPYPLADGEWEADARALAVIAAGFLQDCEDLALHKAYI